MKKKFIILLVFIGVGAFVLGRITGSGGHAMSESAVSTEHVAEWTCSMHPSVRQPEPGQCPICAMDLIPVSTERSDDVAPSEIRLSPTAEKLATVRTVPVSREPVVVSLRLSGKIEYDETSVAEITAWTAGRIDELFVDYTGATVGKNDPLVSLYSPDLIAAQEELIQGLASVDALRSGTPAAQQRADAMLRASRDKLRLLGLADEQIEAIETRGETDDHVIIQSPISGVVVAKDALEGKYVDAGTRIYTVADLSRVWVILDVYEQDLHWLREGQPVEVETEALPGERFTGEIAFIDPILNAKTRTVKVRVEADNPDSKLKPGMFVHATVQATTDTTGAPLVIPATAPLITGERAVVYVAVPGKKGVYEGRIVTLGPRAGDFYVVADGLAEGEAVVVNGAYKIDSSAQIHGKPSMMSPATADTRPQTHCPIMGGAINKDVFADHNGYRVYFCCPGCDSAFAENPDGYIEKMQAEGITVERTP